MTIKAPRRAAMASQIHHHQSNPSETLSTPSTSPTSRQPVHNKSHLYTFPPAPTAPNTTFTAFYNPSDSPTADMSSISDLEATLATLSLRPLPYECTRNCGDAFATPSPWKRHENSAHATPELWRCDMPSADSSSTAAYCTHLSYTQASFVAHLVGVHGAAEADVSSAYCEERRIGGGHQGNFWCGFCVRKVALLERGVDALDERFAHLIAHFIEGMRVAGDWVGLGIPLEGGEGT